jgi:hypothetical protein
LFNAAKSNDFEVFISPHYYFITSQPTTHGSSAGSSRN